VRARRWWMLGVTCLSMIVITLDLTILNIALPAISAGLHAGTGDLQWLGDAVTKHYQGDDTDLKPLMGAILTAHHEITVEEHRSRVEAFFAEATAQGVSAEQAAQNLNHTIVKLAAPTTATTSIAVGERRNSTFERTTM